MPRAAEDRQQKAECGQPLAQPLAAAGPYFIRNLKDRQIEHGVCQQHTRDRGCPTQGYIGVLILGGYRAS